MRLCPYQTKEEYIIEYQGYKIGDKEVKKTVFMPCIGCNCAAYDSVERKCTKTGIVCDSYLGSDWTSEIIQ